MPAPTRVAPMLLPVEASTVVPVPICDSAPAPLSVPLILKVSLRLTASVEVPAKTITLPVPTLPDVPPLPTTSVPSLTTVLPE